MGARVLVVGGSPQGASPEVVRRAAQGCDAVVAVDRGLDAVLAAGLICDLFCGDADTVSAEGAALVARAVAEGCFEVERYDPHKDFTDLSLALRAVAEGCFEVERYDPHKDFTDLSLALRAIGARWPGATLCATCLSGGRPDHLLGVLGRLVSWGGAVEIVEDAFRGRVLRAGETWGIEGARGRTFSFVPLAPGARVSLAGMRWNLDDAPVGFLSDLGISNVVEDSPARVACDFGAIACWLFD